VLFAEYLHDQSLKATFPAHKLQLTKDTAPFVCRKTRALARATHRFMLPEGHTHAFDAGVSTRRLVVMQPSRDALAAKHAHLGAEYDAAVTTEADVAARRATMKAHMELLVAAAFANDGEDSTQALSAASAKLTATTRELTAKKHAVELRRVALDASEEALANDDERRPFRVLEYGEGAWCCGDEGHDCDGCACSFPCGARLGGGIAGRDAHLDSNDGNARDVDWRWWRQ
jgi:hypothetical protein